MKLQISVAMAIDNIYTSTMNSPLELIAKLAMASNNSLYQHNEFASRFDCKTSNGI